MDPNSNGCPSHQTTSQGLLCNPVYKYMYVCEVEDWGVAVSADCLRVESWVSIRHVTSCGLSSLYISLIGRTVPLLKPPPHCYLGEVDHAKNPPPPPPPPPPNPWPHGKPGLIALIGPLRPYCSQSPLILLRCVTEIKFAQNLH